MNELEKMYLDLIQPSKLVEYFLDEQDFREWLRLGGPEEMRWALKAFENEELYSHCKIIKEEIELAEKEL